MPLSLTQDIYIFDIEADNLLKEATKIHCLSIGKVKKDGTLKIVTTTDYDVMRDFFLRKDITKIGHNIIRYDLPVVDKILGITSDVENIVDTLPLSWIIFTRLKRHGLEEWGEYFGIPKPVISDWSSLSVEEYMNRCAEDVKINFQLWLKELSYLRDLYNTDTEVSRFIEYSNFKSLCVREQEEVGVRFDVDNCIKVMKELEGEIQPKLSKLQSLMPKVEVTSKKKKPKEMYKKDGSMTKKWQDWLQFRLDFGIPDDYPDDEIEYISGYQEPNAGSSSQLKDWLFSLGWEPQTFTTSAPSKVTGESKEVPQIYKEDKTLCDSIKALYDKVPELVELDNLGRLKHRLSLLKGFMEEAVEVEEGHLRLYGTISGYTNTMRLIHKKPLVNLPKVTLPYSEGIRACLITDSEKKLLCGADLSGIESVTRNSYLKPYDPEYVEELDNPMYDPHIDIGILAGFFSKEEGELYINIDKGIITDPTEEQKSIFKKIKPLRGKAKSTNFGATYGIGKAKLSKMAKITMNEAKKLLDIYWQRNWAIKAFAADCEVKSIGDQMWIKNPVSQFWYSLRSDKDRFSTVNQSTAVYVLDFWLRQVRAYGVKVQYQCHDEILFSLSRKKVDLAKEMLSEAMKIVNSELGLNVTVSFSQAFGVNYAETH